MINHLDFESFTDKINFEQIIETQLKDNETKRILKEIILSVTFIAITLCLAYQMTDRNTFHYQSNLKNLFGAGDKSTKFLDVISFNLKDRLKNLSILRIKGDTYFRYLELVYKCILTKFESISLAPE